MRKYTLLFTLSLIWGSQFLFIALITHDASAITISFYKALLATLFLFIMTLFMRKTPYKKQWSLYILIAIFEVVIPFIFIVQGQRYISSGMASIIIALTPVFTLFILILIRQRKFNLVEIFALILGIFGIVILSWNPEKLGLVEYVSLGLLLIASLSFAISLVLMQNLQDDVPIHHMRNVLSIATIILIPITIFSSNTFTLHFDSLQWSSLIILGLVHSALAYVIYNILVRQYDAVFASLSNYIVPVVGVLLGVLILHEHLTLNIIIGSAVVLLSLIISQQVKSG
ncbi:MULTISPECIES: DMT family transporter [Mammaliicoccus]|uniref:DMT family transporter n=1 Tax=Mammaliicoccus TaxID=2803850 RepID=UPI001C4FC3E6|nr:MULTISPECIES: EamA family transporter [Mammaliicoccus]MBW0767593.1 EamA family transporter [Mammaliicoccus lentus]WHI55048.1 EamA family transporter [Mammaliicoccus lentus]WHI57570.1 EamA family transporter [Mammaliicoccus lentus]WHI65418.1 EamA family transporter [Mammaliicoccus lentus]WHI86309.1 EamA family transporter [Mammaliicoccus lentus]